MTQPKPYEPRVYRVYDDSDDGEMVYVAAKNRKEAPKIAGITYTHVCYCPSLQWIDGKAVDQWGRIHENRRK